MLKQQKRVWQHWLHAHETWKRHYAHALEMKQDAEMFKGIGIIANERYNEEYQYEVRALRMIDYEIGKTEQILGFQWIPWQLN